MVNANPHMRKIFLLLISVFCVANVLTAQPIQRNLLERFSLADINAALLPKDQWKPFPVTPAEWKQKVPDSVLHHLVIYGEEAVKKPFPSISASVALEYLRTGDRDNY